MEYSYIIYDGHCGFCNRTIMFIAKNDTNDNFRFVSSPSALGEELLSIHKIKGLEETTIILLESNNIFLKSVALKKIFFKTPKYYFLGALLSICPKMVSDYFYDFVSDRRKSIIKNNICELPSAEIRKNFI